MKCHRNPMIKSTIEAIERFEFLSCHRAGHSVEAQSSLSQAKEIQVSLKLSDTAPNFQIATTAGDIDFHQWAGDSWVFFFSHQADFTPV